MNKIMNYTDYITPSRTLETITYGGSDKILYIYNYEGIHFRVFNGLLELAQFFELGTEPRYDFTEERDLDFFIRIFERY